MQQTPPVGEPPPGAKSKAAGSLVLTLNARWNIFGLPVTYEVFTYLVVATVSAPYILCIMFLGLMLMVVGMATVFVILLIVIYLSKYLITVVNKVAPEETPKKAPAVAPTADTGAMDAIKAAVEILTAGKGQVIKIEKL